MRHNGHGEERYKNREYGPFTVGREYSGSAPWYVEDSDDARFETTSGTSGKTAAQALAGALETCQIPTLETVVQPDFDPNPTVSDTEAKYERWAIEAHPIPAQLLRKGYFSAVGYLCGAYRMHPPEIATQLAVPEKTVQRHINDLRAGKQQNGTND